MSGVEFTPGVRANIPLLILLSGGTGSGKTESAMRLATGLAAGKPFAVVDTENGRALHKADDYDFAHAELHEPFTPEAYTEAVNAADAKNFPVVVIDSGSHEWEGVGGVLDMQAAEFARLGSKDSVKMASWIKPKERHKRFVQTLLRSRAHVILCLRAQDKIEIVKEGGKTVVREKQSLIGAQGWVPICEKRLPFEATVSLLLLQDRPGFPVPIKLEERHKALVSLDEPLSEETGVRLREWAAGGAAAPKSQSDDEMVQVLADASETLEEEAERLTALVMEYAWELGKATETQVAIGTNKAHAGADVAAHIKWLTRACDAGLEEVVAARGAASVATATEPEPDSLFQPPPIKQEDPETGQ